MKQKADCKLTLSYTKMKLYICSASSEADVLWIYNDISQQLGLRSTFFCRASDITEAADCIVHSETAGSCAGIETGLIPARSPRWWSRVYGSYWTSGLLVVSL